MKSLAPLSGAGILAIAAWMPSLPPPPTKTIAIVGGFRGSLAPCGCSAPMIGGLQRIGTAAKGAEIISVGPLVKGSSRQDVLKFEGLTEGLGALGAKAVAFDRAQPWVDEELFLAGERLSRGALSRSGTFTAAGLPGQVGKPEEIESEARIALLTQGGQTGAETLAKRLPELSLIVYDAIGTAATERIGRTTLATPGSEGRYLVRATVEPDGTIVAKTIALGPEYADDPRASKPYRAYLARVGAERLLDQVVRKASDPFVGSQTCASCHSSAATVHGKSAHAHAFATLEKAGHDKDPDCVGCHVVGLTSSGGFVSRMKTPKLAEVGCESCHGAGAKHSSNPKIALRRGGKETCLTCHTPDNSPRFAFRAYWQQIIHKDGDKTSFIPKTR